MELSLVIELKHHASQNLLIIQPFEPFSFIKFVKNWVSFKIFSHFLFIKKYF